ncbi:MAG: PTS sugar transporter subunit IIA [Brachybacterium sp.]|nr:PTS sugar transporter subunit IIA [Brachybacterium sp.]
MSTTTDASHGEVEQKQRGGARVVVQKVGTALSNMVMPNIPALIAWGILTALFIPDGPFPNEGLTSMVGPMIHYLLPLLIANVGGRMVYDVRGGVVGVIATMGVIAGSDWLIAQENARLLQEWVAAGNAEADFSELGQVHMFIGAMIMAPLAAWLMKKLDTLWNERIPAGFEMLVNLFSAGIFGFLMMLVGFYGLAPIVNGLMSLLSSGVEGLINLGLLPLVSLLIEPAKVFFLNNAINHGVLTPLGLQQSAADGKSVLFLLEANPGPGAGILLAYTFFGRGMARASAPGALLIHFVGGIHEIYFPYVLMKPILILAAIGGGMTGVFVNVLFGSGLRAPAAPGSIIAIIGNATTDSYLGVILSVVGATAVSFVLAAIFLRLGRKDDDGDLAAATSKMEEMKGKKSSVSGALTGGAAASGHTGPIHKIVFACDAGMGSSAMGASVLRKKVRGAGFSDVEVTNKAISSLTDEWDVVVTQKELTPRAQQRTGSAVHVSVDQFMNSPRYDEVVDLVRERNSGEVEHADAPSHTHAGFAGGAAAGAGAAAASSGGTHRADGPAVEGDREADEAARATEASGTHAADAGTPGDRDQVAPSDSDSGSGSGSEILARESIVLGGRATSTDAAIDEAGALLVSAGAVEQAYVDAMHERERSVSTFMGNGLAIPHGTNEAKSTITRSGMSFIRFDEPIDWNGNPVNFVIGIAGVGNEHLELLQNVAMTFSDPAQVEKLEKATTAEEILAVFDENKG